MRLLIVEDEPMVANRIERFCREILGEELELLRRAETFPSAASDLSSHTFDGVLLDLNLHGADGMELVRDAAAGAFHTIIVSANIDRAIEAFEVGVIDFVPKPFSKERLAEALDRIRRQQAAGRARLLAIRKQGKLELIPVDDVLYVKGAGPYSELVLRSGKIELHDKSLEKLGAILPESFERIHKSFLVRMDSIVALHSHEGSRYEAELTDGTFLPVGRTRIKEIRESLG